jgi:hypothetical protein
MIDCKLKYLFKGRTGWAIKQIGDKEFILHFPSEELRHELTMFKVFEFVTDVVKARVEATNLEEIVNVLEETWIKASSSGSNEKNVIKEISYLVGDPIEVDESSLEDENAIRVKVNYRDATKIEGSTLVYIKGQGHMITWWSKKKVDAEPKNSPPPKTSKFDCHKVDTDEEEDKDESTVSYESRFARMAKEMKEEE